VDGIEKIRYGEYIVEREINVRKGGRIYMKKGVNITFKKSVGVMVDGKFEDRGSGKNEIRIKIKEEIVEKKENEKGIVYNKENNVKVRIIGGRNNKEGRLKVRIGGIWGKVCKYGWKMIDEDLVCNKMGLVMKNDDWFLER
jgi:hypothetical protein